MAKVRNSANTIRQGRIGENTWYVRDGVQVVRQRLQNSNYGEGARRSSAQQERRSKWGNLVNFYKSIKSWQPKAYEGLRAGQTDYNAFMSLNANSSPAYLTRQLVEAGGSVVGAYAVSKGTLPQLNYQLASQSTAWELAVSGSTTLISNVTIANVSTLLIASNYAIEEGDNVAFVFFKCAVDNGGVPRSSFVYKEFTIDTDDTTEVSTLGLSLGRPTTSTGLLINLGSSSATLTDGFAMIHTRKTSGSLLVSSQSIINKSNAIVNNYTTNAAKAAAIASYGIDGDVPLAPGA